MSNAQGARWPFLLILVLVALFTVAILMLLDARREAQHANERVAAQVPFNVGGYGRVNAWKAILAAANNGLAQRKANFPLLDDSVVAEEDTKWYGLAVYLDVNRAGSSFWIFDPATQLRAQLSENGTDAANPLRLIKDQFNKDSPDRVAEDVGTPVARTAIGTKSRLMRGISAFTRDGQTPRLITEFSIPRSCLIGKKFEVRDGTGIPGNLVIEITFTGTLLKQIRENNVPQGSLPAGYKITHEDFVIKLEKE